MSGEISYKLLVASFKGKSHRIDFNNYDSMVNKLSSKFMFPLANVALIYSGTCVTK